MKERPILFSGEMVRAILEGRKTQTRRLYRSRPADNVDDANGPVWSLPSPYGSPGDRLWVRETWSHDAPDLDACRAAYEDASAGIGYGPYYRATEVAPDTLKWHPAIFMPRWASRFTLEVTEVRVQRLQEISEEDARAEGVEPYTPPHGHISPEQRVPGPGFERCRLGDQPHRLPFADLWDRINGKRCPWSSNPWVWAISFRRIP